MKIRPYELSLMLLAIVVISGVLLATSLFIYVGENTLWVSQQTIQDYVDGKASVTVECGLPSK